jgi:hypothetical protein
MAIEAAKYSLNKIGTVFLIGNKIGRAGQVDTAHRNSVNMGWTAPPLKRTLLPDSPRGGA